MNEIPTLKEHHYFIKNVELDGDAPKKFIKAYFFEPDSTVRIGIPQSWHAYIAKTAAKWYPHESIIECMINRIGQELSIRMNDIKLVQANGQIRFLSKYFLGKNEKLIHGAEICGEYLGDMLMAEEIANNKPTARELFTFEFIKDSIRYVFPQCFELLLKDLVTMMVFDAIVGNNDRHFYNWGVIGHTKKSYRTPIFAPLYDSARGLYWNISDAACKNYLDLHKKGHQKIVNYVENAFPRISIEDNKDANHFEIIDYLKRYRTEYQDIIRVLSSFENEERVLKMLNQEFFRFFIPERSELISIILKLRFNKIREVIK